MNLLRYSLLKQETAMTLTTIKDRLLEAIRTVLGRGSDRVSGRASLTIDPGMDSLNLMQPRKKIRLTTIR